MRPAVHATVLLSLVAFHAVAAADPVDAASGVSGNAPKRAASWVGGFGVFGGYLEPSHDGGRGYAEPSGLGPALRATFGRRISERVGIVAGADVQPSIGPGLVGGPSLSGALLLSAGVEFGLPATRGSWVFSLGAGYAALRLGGRNEDRESCNGSIFAVCLNSPEQGGTGTGGGYRIAIGRVGDRGLRVEAALMDLSTDGDWLDDAGDVRTRIVQVGFVKALR